MRAHLRTLIVMMIAITICALSLSSAAAVKQRVALIMNQPLGDPFANLVYAGLQKLEKERDIDAKLIESLDKSEHVEQARAMARWDTIPS